MCVFDVCGGWERGTEETARRSPARPAAAAAAEEETYGGESAAAPNVSAPVYICLCVCLRRAERRGMCGRILALMGLIRSRLTVEVLCE